MAKPILRFERVDRSFGRQRSVAAVDLAVRPGEWVSLIGPTGSGKATVIRLAAGLEPPDHGSVRLLGEPASQRSTLSRSGIGVALSDADLDPDETVHSCLRYRGRLQGVGRAAFADRMSTLLEMLSIADKASDRLRALSELDRCRTAIAAAVIHAPRLLILGAFGTTLGPPARRMLLGNVGTLRDAEGLGVLWATTRFADAEAADRVAIINEGIIRFDGTAAELMKATGAQPAAGAVAELIAETTGLPVPP